MRGESEKRGEGIRPMIIVLGVAVGIALLLFGGGFFSSDNKEEPISELVYNRDETEYEARLVEKITKICSSVRGAGNVSVAVELDGSFKAVYAQNIQSNFSDGINTQKHEYVFVGGGSSECAVLIGYSPPEILGVGIVCTGGNNPSVRAELISLVSATFDLPTNKIYITASQN